MDFVIGLIVGLFFGGWIGLAVASLITISRDKDIEDIKAELEDEGYEAVMEEAIETLKKQRVVRITQQAPTVSRLDDDTWKEDMERDAQLYEAGE